MNMKEITTINELVFAQIDDIPVYGMVRIECIEDLSRCERFFVLEDEKVEPDRVEPKSEQEPKVINNVEVYDDVMDEPVTQNDSNDVFSSVVVNRLAKIVKEEHPQLATEPVLPDKKDKYDWAKAVALVNSKNPIFIKEDGSPNYHELMAELGMLPSQVGSDYKEQYDKAYRKIYNKLYNLRINGVVSW